MISRRPAIQILVLGMLLVGTRLAVDLTSAAAYVYPDFDFGQFWLVFLFFLILLVFVAVLAIVRFFQRRSVEGLALVAIACIPFLFKDVVDRHKWKFELHKSEYQLAIARDLQPSPKFRVFNWGNRNTHAMGGGFIIEGIVYDESDEIALAPEARSINWIELRAHPAKEDYWVTQPSKSYTRCKRRIVSFKEHFYYVSEEC